MKDLLESLSHPGDYPEAAPEGPGRFTIDSQRAVEQLGRLQLPTPHHYVLKLIQAAVASGAPAVAVQVGWRGVTVDFSPPQPLVLSELFHHLLAGPSALRHLAVGVNSALAGARWVAVEQGGRSHLFSPKASWEEPAGPRPGVRIRVNRYSLECCESSLLVARCGWSPVPILLNDRSLELSHWGPRSGLEGHHLVEQYLRGHGIRAPWQSFASLPPRVYKQELGAPIPCAAALALIARRFGDTTLELVQDGVAIDQRSFNFKGHSELSLRGVMEVQGMATDLSGFKLLQDSILCERIAGMCDEYTPSMISRWQSQRVVGHLMPMGGEP